MALPLHRRLAAGWRCPGGQDIDQLDRQLRARADAWRRRLDLLELRVRCQRHRYGNAVCEFTPAGTNLEYYGSTQASYGALSNTAGIAIGPAGRIYVVNADYSLVTVLNPDGSFYTDLGLQSDPANTAQDLSFPQGIAVTADGTVYVADGGNGRVAEYSPAPVAAVVSGVTGAAKLTGAAAARPANPGFPRLSSSGAATGAAIALALAALTGFLAWRRRVAAARPVPGTPAQATSPAANSVAASGSNPEPNGNAAHRDLDAGEPQRARSGSDREPAAPCAGAGQ